MTFHRRTLMTCTILVLLSACATEPQTPLPSEARPPLDSLVSVDWLAAHLDEPDVIVLDCTVMFEDDGEGGMRTISGRANYEAGHIPGAGFADLKGALSDSGQPIGYAVPAPEVFAAAMGRLGVGNDTRVVLYSANNPSWAARVWWMLRWIGFDRAALLDGGLKAWTDSGRPLSTDTPVATARRLSVSLRPGLIANQVEVRNSIEDENVTIIDALSEAHYRGETAMYARPGHITGAVNVPVFNLYDEDGMFRSLDEAQALFSADRDGRAITYCGGGIAASTSAFVLTRLGYDNVAVYTASLQEWTMDPGNPMETDEADDVLLQK